MIFLGAAMLLLGLGTLVIGLLLLFVKDKRPAKVVLLLAAICLLVGFSICSTSKLV